MPQPISSRALHAFLPWACMLQQTCPHVYALLGSACMLMCALLEPFIKLLQGLMIMLTSLVHGLAHLQLMHQVVPIQPCLSHIAHVHMCHAPLMTLSPHSYALPKPLCTWVCLSPNGALLRSMERPSAPQVCHHPSQPPSALFKEHSKSFPTTRKERYHGCLHKHDGLSVIIENPEKYLIWKIQLRPPGTQGTNQSTNIQHLLCAAITTHMPMLLQLMSQAALILQHCLNLVPTNAHY